MNVIEELLGVGKGTLRHGVFLRQHDSCLYANTQVTGLPVRGPAQ